MNTFTAPARLARDAETRNLPSGQSVTNLRIAVDTGYGDRKRTLWLDGALWGERGTKLAPMLTKGSQVVVTGELREREWTAQDGATRTALELDIRDLAFVGSRRDAETPAAGEAPAPAQAGFPDDEVPF